MWQLATGDVVAWARDYQGPKFHALICDPPYHLTSITKRFGKEGSAPAKYGKDGAFSRASKGFMGKTWDGGDLAFQPETWAVLKDLLLPGAFGFAYASARGWHRMAVAIEDAGFIFHPTVFMFGWVQGQGFPKATRIDTQIDKAAGAEREVIDNIDRRGQYDGAHRNSAGNTGDSQRAGRDSLVPMTAPVTEMAQQWGPYRYGL